MAQSTKMTTEEYINGNGEITVNLSIPSFKKLYDSAKSAKRIRILEEKFTAGGKKWAFQLHQEKTGDVGVFLYFYGENCTSAEYTGYLKSSKGKFIYIGYTGRQNYAPDNANIEGAASKWGLLSCKTLSQLQNGGFLEGGTLQLKFVVKVYSGNTILKRTKASEDFKKFYSGVGADITFVFVKGEGSRVIGKTKAHRQILALRNPVFATMFASATDGKVKIDDMTPISFWILLKFIYSGEVDWEWGSVAEELIYAAEKYDLKALQNYLCKNVASVLTVKNVRKIRSLASLHKLPQILKATMKFLKENTEDFVDNA